MLVRTRHTEIVRRAFDLCHPEIEIFESPELFPGEHDRFAGREGAREWIERTFAIWDVEFTARGACGSTIRRSS